MTTNGKIFGPTKVGVVGPLPPALIDHAVENHSCVHTSLFYLHKSQYPESLCAFCAINISYHVNAIWDLLKSLHFILAQSGDSIIATACPLKFS